MISLFAISLIIPVYIQVCFSCICHLTNNTCAYTPRMFKFVFAFFTTVPYSVKEYFNHSLALNDGMQCAYLFEKLYHITHIL